MFEQPLEFDPYKLAAIVYHPADDIDTVLAEFAFDLQRAGERVGGVVQTNRKAAAEGPCAAMQLTDLMTQRIIPIAQPLGAGAAACRLDPAGLAEASLAVNRAIDAGVSLVVVNKFSKQEAAGRGLRQELARAVLEGLPVLTAVPDKCLPAWCEFTGDRGTMLLCARRALDRWWAEITARRAWLRQAAETDAVALISR